MSPGRRPARAAGLPGRTSASTTPSSRGSPRPGGEHRRQRLRAHADVAAAHVAVLADLLVDGADDVARRGEAEAVVSRLRCEATSVLMPTSGRADRPAARRCCPG